LRAAIDSNCVEAITLVLLAASAKQHPMFMMSKPGSSRVVQSQDTNCCQQALGLCCCCCYMELISGLASFMNMPHTIQSATLHEHMCVSCWHSPITNLPYKLPTAVPQ
jgi:hypothetical protein